MAVMQPRRWLHMSSKGTKHSCLPPGKSNVMARDQKIAWAHESSDHPKPSSTGKRSGRVPGALPGPGAILACHPAAPPAHSAANGTEGRAQSLPQAGWKCMAKTCQ
eukprot:scaffold321222_cov47-Prasinocladus_malaysianus.AAC.1